MQLDNLRRPMCRPAEAACQAHLRFDLGAGLPPTERWPKRTPSFGTAVQILSRPCLVNPQSAIGNPQLEIPLSHIRPELPESQRPVRRQVCFNDREYRINLFPS